MTHSAQLDRCVERVFEGVKYTIAYSQQTRRVTYLHTDDRSFKTVDGLRIGDSIPVSTKDVQVLLGWEVHAPATRDGWRPVLGYDLADLKLNDGTVLDLSMKGQSAASGMATILGFSKGRF